MSRRRLYLAPEQLGMDRPQTRAEIGGEPHRYLSRVLRLAVGDRLVVFDGLGNERDAEIVAVTGKATTLLLGETRKTPPARVSITLLQALPRGERMDLVVQKTTELGVAKIVPVLSARSVAQPGGGEARLRRWRTIAQEAARQCGRADVPAIEAPAPLADALASLGAASAPRAGDRRLLVWEESRGAPLRRALAGDETAVTLLVGPEGGFEPAEAQSAQAAGFEPVGLGPRVLRSETAAVVAVALTQAALGELD